MSVDIKQEATGMDGSSGITPKSEPSENSGEDLKPSPMDISQTSTITPVASPAPQKPRQKKGMY